MRVSRCQEMSNILKKINGFHREFFLGSNLKNTLIGARDEDEAGCGKREVLSQGRRHLLCPSVLICEMESSVSGVFHGLFY